jgi:hypothetical protein
MEEAKYLKVISNNLEIGKILDSGDPVDNAKRYIQLLKDKNLYVEISQTKLMFKQARSFATVSRDIHRGYLVSPPFNQEVVAPFVVNAAFACEMYLKALQSLTGQIDETHSLNVLFRHLPNKMKDKINALNRQKAAQFQLESRTSFKEHLKTISNAFVDWRYIYEQEKATANISVILLILTVLDTHLCNELKKKQTT